MSPAALDGVQFDSTSDSTVADCCILRHARVMQVSDFYDFYAGQQEAWDGPALLVFSDGRTVGARLDRNGLRPARFWRTSDGFLYVASEVGVFGDVLTNAENVVRI